VTGWVKNRTGLLAAGFGAVLSIGIALPFMGPGRLWLLDWVNGPHTQIVPAEALGLNGGLTAGLPYALAVDWLGRAIGQACTWLPLVAVFPLASWGIARLVGGPKWCWLAAATLYCVNPFVFQRVYVGHIALLLDYALLPLASSSALRFVKSGKWWLPTPALWWAVLTALSPHFAWIYGVVLVAVWLMHHPLRPSALTRVLVVCLAFVVLSAYALIPQTATEMLASHGTTSLLALYRTTGDPHLGLFPNVLGLYGFWRLGPGPQLPKNVFSGWSFVLLAILVVVAVGAFQHMRRNAPADPITRDMAPGQPSGRCGAAAVLIVGVAGYFLALGDQGPTGSLFRWAYFHVPFFAIMEEPQKFLMLTALAYAIFFGWGVEHLVGAAGRVRLNWRTAGAVSLAVVLPLAYTPTIFDGLAGQLTVSKLPPSWSAADHMMGDGPGQILFLPWHLYMAFPFTGGRVIANPAPTSFRRSVISGDNVEAGGIESTSTSPRSAYLQRLFPDGRTIHNFGKLVAPLGVEFVVLAKTADWQSYSWLASQPDLSLVMDSPSLDVWRNATYAGVGQSSTARQVRQISPIAYAIGPGHPGEVTLDAVYQKGWKLGSQPASESPQGTIRFHVGATGGVVRFTPWGITKLGYVVSGGAFVLLSGLVLVVRLRRGRGGTYPQRR